MTDEITNISKAVSARNEDEERARRFVTVGGLIDRASVSLCVYGDNLIPEAVSKALGIAPTRAHRKGEPMKSRSPHAPRDAAHRTGAWILKVRGKAPQEPEELTAGLLDQLPDDNTVWDEIAARHDIWLSYGLHMDAWNRGFALSPEMVSRIARMHARMNFDIYAYPEDEEGQV
jgi:hypothetical protein